MSACVKPGEASWKSFNLKLSSVEKLLVYCGYLKLTARRRFDVGGYVDNLVRVEVETNNGIVAFGTCRFFFD